MTSRAKPHLGPGRFSLTLGPTRFHPVWTRLGCGLMRMLNVMQEIMPPFSFSSLLVLCKRFPSIFMFSYLYFVWDAFNFFILFAENLERLNFFSGCVWLLRKLERLKRKGGNEFCVLMVLLFYVSFWCFKYIKWCCL